MEKSKLIASILLSTALFFSSICTASPLTPEAALSRAIGNTGHKNLPARGMKDYRLVYTEPRSNSDEAAVYVFATGDKGYIIASADDVAYPVLGYSDEPFDESAMSLGWIKEYARQIEVADSDTPADDKYPFKEYDRIEPMIKTHWGNGSIYRDHTPQIDGNPCHPGDMAVAMAQIMNYHKYPAVGQGKTTYLSDRTEIKYDFSTLKLDWDAMLPAYDENCTDEQKSAIAELIYACGVATNMQYDSKKSTATFENAALGLVEFFGYDKGIHVDYCSYYTLQAWNDMVYKYLAESGPMIYHFYNYYYSSCNYICDGYDSEGLFHFNAGMGGKNDGYYRLSALSERQGYDLSNHYIISNINPARENSEAEVNLGIRENLYLSTEFDPEVIFGRVIIIGSALTNHGVGPVIGMPVIELTSQEGLQTYAYVYPKENLALYPGESIGSYKICMPKVAKGEYTLSLKFQTKDGKTHPIKHNQSDCQIIGTASDNAITVMTQREATITSVVQLRGDIYWDDEFYVDATFRCRAPRPVEKQFYLCAYNKTSGHLAAWCDPITVTIDTDEDSKYMTLYPKFTHFIESQCSGKSYNVQFVDAQTIDRIVSPYANCNIYPGTCPDPLDIKTFRFIGDNRNADPTNLEIKLYVKNKSGIHDLKSDLVLGFSDGKYAYLLDNSCLGDDTELMPQQEYEKTITIEIKGAEAGKSYDLLLGKRNGEQIRIEYSLPVIMATSGIEDVSVDGGEAEYYNLQGVRIDNPSHGYYIKRSGNSTSKVYIP